MCILGMHIHGLAHAASGYHKVLEENRRLYNEVQDLKGIFIVTSHFVHLHSLIMLQMKRLFVCAPIQEV